MSKEKILEFYYTDHLKVNDISEKLNVSSAYVTKIIKVDIRYAEEKLYRKELSRIKRLADKNKFMKNKREIEKYEDNYKYVQAQHDQDVRELSDNSHLSNESYRKWNNSAYKYNPLKDRYEFDETLGRAADVPKYIRRCK